MPLRAFLGSFSCFSGRVECAFRRNPRLFSNPDEAVSEFLNRRGVVRLVKSANPFVPVADRKGRFFLCVVVCISMPGDRSFKCRGGGSPVACRYRTAEGFSGGAQTVCRDGFPVCFSRFAMDIGLLWRILWGCRGTFAADPDRVLAYRDGRYKQTAPPERAARFLDTRADPDGVRRVFQTKFLRRVCRSLVRTISCRPTL